MSGLLVTVVDDDASIRRAFSRLLRAAGYTTATFASAEEYLAHAAQDTSRCLVLDVHLGGASGFELQRRLSQRGDAPPVVFVTAHENPEYPELARRMGCELLTKPVVGTELLAAVQRAIAQSAGGEAARVAAN